MKFSLKKIWLITGPIILSALSILLTSIFLQITIKYFCPSFNLLANKGLGKIIFTTLVILQITLFIALHSKQFFKNFLETNLYFFKKKDFIKIFFKYFFIFLLLHSFILFIFYIAGFVIYNPNWGSFNFRLIYQTLFGFIATFFLAWTEELIFRGTIFPYLNKNFNLITSVLITNLIFMFVHDLHNPLNLITKNWQLGLGLFLLGVILNLIFILTNKLYANMGAHAGLVFVKVILRRARFILFLPASDLPFWINQDLRYSYLTHILFLITIIILIFKIKKI